MFERFYQSARQVVVRARHEATRSGQDRIGCEHLLLALIAQPGSAAEALTAAGLETAGLRALVQATARPDADPLDGEALASLGIDLDAVRRAADAAFGPGALDRVRPARRGRIRITSGTPFTPEARKSLELALRAASRLHHPGIATGHLLIGIIDQGGNAALDVLRASGANTADLRDDVVRRIAAAA
jgi:ATP-dependent Clp protease ATP-binding subunit ClpA